MGRRSSSNPIDWELIEKEYRLGQSTLRQLAATHKVQASAISRKAKKEAWVQDKSAAVKALSDAQLLVSNSRKATAKATPTPQDIEVAATVRTNVVLGHRKDIARTAGLFRSLLSELEFTTEQSDRLEDVFDLLNDPGDSGSDAQQRRVEKARKALADVLSLPGRVDAGKRLTEMLEKLVRMEREAFGIDSEPEGDGSAKSFIEAMLNARARAVAR